VVQNISHKMKHASRYEKNLVSDLEGWIVKWEHHSLIFTWDFIWDSFHVS
jgi:hypothetical protein